MPQITITQQAHNAIRSAAEFSLDDSTTIRLGPNALSITIGLDVLERLQGVQLQGESLSDTILRAIAVGPGVVRIDKDALADAIIEAIHQHGKQ